MQTKNDRLIFELSNAEKEAKLKRVLSKAIESAVKLNQPFVYRNELCVKPNLFIHKYPDGKELLIEQDNFTSSEKIVKVLN